MEYDTQSNVTPLLHRALDEQSQGTRPGDGPGKAGVSNLHF